MSAALTFLGAASLAGWLGVLLHPARPWDLQPRDAEQASDPAAWPRVCALVPARNESGVLPLTLPHLLAQDYPGPWRVVLVDDRSTDGTGDAARSLASSRLAVVDGDTLPDGWVGKVWALEQAAAFVDDAEYLLLTDADIVHAPSSLRTIVAESVAHDLALDSRMALLHVNSAIERLLVPPFAFFFALLFPMRWANESRCRLAAAAGGCVLVRADALVAAGGFTAIRGAVIDDISLARAVKRLGVPIRLSVSGGGVRSVRAYQSLGAFWRTVRRTAFTQLRRSWALLGATTTALALLFVAPPVLVVLGIAGAGGWPVTLLGGLAWLAAALAYLPTVRFYGCSPLWALTLPLAGALYGGMTVDSAIRGPRAGNVVW